MLVAIRGGDLEAVRRLVVAGSCPLSAALHAMQTSSEESRSVRWAIFVNVAGRSNPNTPDMGGVQALLCAIELGLEQCALWLMRHCPKIDVNNGFALRDRVPLVVASRHGMVRCVCALLTDARLDVNWTDGTGKGAVHAALRGGHVAVAKALLSDRRTRWGGAPGRPLVHLAAQCAVEKQRPALLTSLLYNPRVQWAAADRTGTTAAHWLLRELAPAVHDTDTLRAVLATLLQQAPSTVDHVSHSGDNALAACIGRGWGRDLLLDLLRHSTQYLRGFTVDHPALLHVAARCGDYRVCLILLACGFEQEHLIEGETPAIAAFTNGHPLLAVRLLEHARMPKLQLASMAGLDVAHLNFEIRRGAIPQPLNVPWEPVPELSARPASAAPTAYIRHLRAGVWARTLHWTFPTSFNDAAFVLLLCHWRLGAAGLPTEMCHWVLALLPHDAFPA